TFNSKGKAEAESIVQELYYDMNSSYQSTTLEDNNEEFMDGTEEEDK
ncbi:42201_t:CDS:2, partial [Gigaspora margarita]